MKNHCWWVIFGNQPSFTQYTHPGVPHCRNWHPQCSQKNAALSSRSCSRFEARLSVVWRRNLPISCQNLQRPSKMFFFVDWVNTHCRVSSLSTQLGKILSWQLCTVTSQSIILCLCSEASTNEKCKSLSMVWVIFRSCFSHVMAPRSGLGDGGGREEGDWPGDSFH